jgi:outer membrane immunogenic protein
MKTLVFAAAVVAPLIALSQVEAADMRAPVAKALPAAAGCAQFGGFHVGGQGGSTYYDYRWQDLDAFRGEGSDDHQAPDATSATKFGWNAGAQAGYDWQSRCTVFGIEADWSWSNAKASSFLTTLGHSGTDAPTTDISSQLRWFGTIRTRTGIVVDNLLLYVTGGLAYARFNRNFKFTDGDGDFETFSGRQTRWGWTAGVGTEWAINQNWSLKSEALYMAFAKSDQTFTSTNFDPDVRFRFGNQDSAWVSRIGLNYRWGQ